MKHWLIILVVSIVLGIFGLYLLNPYGTATRDPRARIFGYITYHIPSTSMSPTLMKGDYIMVQTAVYAFKPPATGDIIVFRFPRNKNISHVKRVAAVAGEKVAIQEGKLFVNGKLIQESYLADQQVVESFSRTMEEVTVPPGQLFVLGDNRDHANDSRFWGFLPVEETVGKVVYIWAADDRKRIGKVH